MTLTFSFFFFFNDTAPTEIYTLSLHDALPISSIAAKSRCRRQINGCSSARKRAAAIRSPATGRALISASRSQFCPTVSRSEEHTSELQSPCNLVCRLLLEKKKIQQHDRLC